MPGSTIYSNTWGSGNSSYLTYTGTSASNTLTWDSWLGNSISTSYTTTTDPWPRWVNGGSLGYVRAVPVPESDEQRQAREERRAQAEAAKQRAKELLVAFLDEEQTAEFEERQEFHVRGSAGRRYCLKRGRAHNVFEVDDDGRKVVEFCGHVRDSIPDDDNVLAQMLFIQNDEEGYRKLANARRLVAA